MPIPLPPETIILEKMKEIAAGSTLAADFGLAELNVRHHRHRHGLKSERPGLALRYVQSEIDNQRGPMHTSSEQCWAMTVGLVADLSLLPEKDGNIPAGDDNDATGWDRLLGLGYAAAKLFVAMDSPLRTLVDDVIYGDVSPDEDSQPDDGRSTVDVVVLYRTLFDDPLHLLSPEDNQ